MSLSLSLSWEAWDGRLLLVGKCSFGSILFSFLYWKIDWGSSFSAGAFPLQGYSIAFMPSVGRFRDEGVLFDSVPFSWVFISKDF